MNVLYERTFSVFNVIFLFSCFLFSFYSLYAVESALSFCVLLMLLFVLFVNSKKRNSLFDMALVTFFFVFMFVAPQVQLKALELPNTMSIDSTMTVKTNGLLSIFLLSYIMFREININWRITPYINKIKNKKQVGIILTLISICVFLFFFKDVYSSIVFKKITAFSYEITPKASLLLKTKVIYMLPFVAFSFWLFNNKKWTFPEISITLILFLVFIFFKNPINEKRNLIGPLYLSLLYTFFGKNAKHATNKIFLALVLVLLLLFPSIKIFTHSSALFLLNNQVKETSSLFVNSLFSMKKNLSSLDFDAWSMSVAVVEFADEKGFSMGRQLLGSLSFFIPRALWERKPVGTGQVVGTWLMEKYNHWFYQLSIPFPIEGYIDFGVLGVLIFSFALSLVGRISDRLIKCKNKYYMYIGVYMSFYLFYLLRGDLISCLAYFIGFLVSYLFVPYALSNIFSFLKLAGSNNV